MRVGATAECIFLLRQEGPAHHTHCGMRAPTSSVQGADRAWSGEGARLLLSAGSLPQLQRDAGIMTRLPRWHSTVRRGRQSSWSYAALVGAGLCVLIPLLLFAGDRGSTQHVVPAADSAQLQSMSREALETEKLRQEVIDLRQKNQRSGGIWAFLPFAPFLTALVAVAGVLITLWKQITEANRQKELDRAEREKERKQRLDKQFNTIAASLGGDTEAIRASGAVSISLFSRPEYEEYYEQAFMLVLANLKIDHSPAISSLLVNSFEKIARTYIPRHEGELDFSHLTLTGVNLSGLDLTGVDIGYADLRRANFTGATLRRVRGFGAKCDKARFSRSDLQAARLHEVECPDGQFHDASLIDAKMKDANLQGAQFHRTRLQGAHFEGANLKNAQFQQANLNEAHFQGAAGFTTSTLKSIVRAEHWQDAHFDDDVRASLDELATEGNA